MTSSRGWCSLLRCALQRLPRARSDLALSTQWATVRDRTARDEDVNVIPRCIPTFSDTRSRADEQGQRTRLGSPFWTRTHARRKRVLITAERLVPTDALRSQPELTPRAGLHGDAVSHRAARRVAGPCTVCTTSINPAVESYLRTSPRAGSASGASAESGNARSRLVSCDAPTRHARPEPVTTHESLLR